MHVVALGTGQALDVARRGDADLVLVHDPDAEQKFIDEGHGINRREIAWNDFIIVGPGADPAKIKGGRDVVAAFKAIWNAQAPFVSRGDKSGTDALEKRLWKAADLDITKAGAWYKDIGGGMGAALNAAAGMDAYTLSDRGTWLSFNNRRDLVDRARRRCAAAQPLRRDRAQPKAPRRRRSSPSPSNLPIGSPRRRGSTRSANMRWQGRSSSTPRPTRSRDPASARRRQEFLR